MGKKISELQDKVNLSGNERIPFEQDNTNGSITTSSLKNYISKETGGGVVENLDKQGLLNTNSNIGFVSKGDYEANAILFSGEEWIGQMINLHFTQTNGNGAIQLSTTEAEDAIWTTKSLDNVIVPDKFKYCKVLYEAIHLQDDINATFKPKLIKDNLDLVKKRLYDNITEPAEVINTAGNINLENSTITSDGYLSVYFQNTEDDVMELYLKGYSSPYEKKHGIFGFSMSKPNAGVQLENVFFSNVKKQNIDLIVKLQPKQFIYINGNDNKVNASIIRDIKYFVNKQAQNSGDSFTEDIFQNIQDESGLTGKEDNTQNSQIEHLLNIINEKANKKDVYTIAQTNDAINRSKTVVENVLTSTSTTTALSSAQGKILNDLITSLTARVQALETPKP